MSTLESTSIKKKANHLRPVLFSGFLTLILLFGLISSGCQSESKHVVDAMAEPAKASEISADGKSQHILIKVNHGYFPAHSTAKAGLPIKVDFFRNEETPSCDKDIVIKKLNKEFTVPNQGTVTVDIPAQEPGTIEIQCSMDMDHAVIEIIK